MYDSSSTDTAVPNTIWHIVLKVNEAISRSFLLLNQRRGVAEKGGEAGTKKTTTTAAEWYSAHQLVRALAAVEALQSLTRSVSTTFMSSCRLSFYTMTIIIIIIFTQHQSEFCMI